MNKNMKRIKLEKKIKLLENELDKKKDSLKAILEGVSGITPEGIKVVWSEVAGRKSIDEAKVKELLGEVPVKYGKESYRLTVKEG
jgi:hypothetical protein